MGAKSRQTPFPEPIVETPTRTCAVVHLREAPYTVLNDQPTITCKTPWTRLTGKPDAKVTQKTSL